MAEHDVSHRYLGAHRAPPHAHRRHDDSFRCCDATRSYDRTATGSITTLETVIKIPLAFAAMRARPVSRRQEDLTCAAVVLCASALPLVAGMAEVGRWRQEER